MSEQRGKNSSLAADLSSMMKRAVADTPPVVAKQATEAPTPSPAPPVPAERPARAMAAAPRSARAKGVTPAGKSSAVNLTGRAVAALHQVQAAILAEAGTTTTASAAICLALEYLARDLPDGRQRLAELFVELRQDDRRRRRE